MASREIVYIIYYYTYKIVMCEVKIITTLVGDENSNVIEVPYYTTSLLLYGYMVRCRFCGIK